jgi:hypothetical protein
VLGRELLMALAQSQRLSGLNKSAGTVGIFLEVHFSSLSLPLASRRERGSPPSLS